MTSMMALIYDDVDDAVDDENLLYDVDDDSSANLQNWCNRCFVEGDHPREVLRGNLHGGQSRCTNSRQQ